jgi:hypothetical protein
VFFNSNDLSRIRMQQIRKKMALALRLLSPTRG